ncbi:MAG: DUF2235 domain-containing protein [Hellea sp.]
MPKNIVICLDGTGNQIEENISNVLKLYRSLKKNKDQVTFYDQGVGTLGRTDTWGLWKQHLNNAVLGMGFGVGLDANVIRAYEFLIRHYEKDDDVYIFGFSRGAHTARVLAGMVYEIGILKRRQVHLSGAALTAYKQASPIRGARPAGLPEEDFKREYEGNGANFRRVMRPHNAAIKFLGLWDTVSSVIIPNYKNLFWPPFKLEKLPHTANNPAVEFFRQAAAIDERRRMFRLEPWEEGQDYKPQFYAAGDAPKQDVKQRWFAGYHSDIGGGHKRVDSGLSQFPLIWMIAEAKAAGLIVFDRMADYVTGEKLYTDTTKYKYPKKDHKARDHNSLKGPWWLLEIIPKLSALKEWPKKRSLLGLYLPLGEPRYISDDADIDESARDRIADVEGYDPVNVRAEKV